MTLTIAELRAQNPITIWNDTDLIVGFNFDAGATQVSELRTAMLDDAAIQNVPTISTLVTQMATANANIAAFSNQATQVGVHGLGTAQSDSVTTLSDLYSTGANTVAQNTILMYGGWHWLQNNLPTTGTKNVTVTTDGTATIVATTGTFASTDTGRSITGTNIPASTYITFVDATHATLRSANGTAVLATGSGSGIVTTITSSNASWNMLFKFAGTNGPNYSVQLAPNAGGYLSAFQAQLQIGSDGLHHTYMATWRIVGPGTISSTTVPMMIATDQTPSGQPSALLGIDLSWYSSQTTTDYGTLRQSAEARLTPNLKSPSIVTTRIGSQYIMSTP